MSEQLSDYETENEGWDWRVGSQGLEYPLKTRENEDCSKHSKRAPHASFIVLCFSIGSDSDLDCLSFFFLPLNRIEIQTSEAAAWWSLTLRELCSVTPATQSLKSPNEKKKRERERGGAVYDIALQWTPEKRKISINFTRGFKSGWVCRDDFIVQSGRPALEVLARLDKRAASTPASP